jgi:hypothetical protein
MLREDNEIASSETFRGFTRKSRRGNLPALRVSKALDPDRRNRIPV